LHVAWYTHLGRIFHNNHGRRDDSWRKHAYRAFRSLAKDPRYSLPYNHVHDAKGLRYIVQDTIDKHARLPAPSLPPGPDPTGVTRRLFLDVTYTARRDNKSGIQRVIRNLARHSLELGGNDLSVLPVEIKAGRLYPCLLFGGYPADARADKPFTPAPDDILLVIDSGWAMLADYQELLPLLHARGVVIVSVIHDLIPVRHHAFFATTPEVSQNFAIWMGLLFFYSRLIIGNSQATRDEIGACLKRYALARPPALDYFHLGFDRQEIKISRHLSPRVFPEGKINLLMVGTLESRKGYDTALDAFDRLRRDRADLSLHIIGKPTLDTDGTIKRIETHPLLNTALFWHANADDDLLAQAYEECHLLIFASRAEGFGLPLIEAAQKDIPIVASDLPVFMEIAGEHAYYFPAGDGAALARTLETALGDIANQTARRSKNISILSWKESGEMLMRAVRAGVPQRETASTGAREQQDHRIAELLRLIFPNGQPNLHQLNQRLKEMDNIKLVIKQFGHELATRLYDTAAVDAVGGPSEFSLRSKPCTQADMEHPAFRWWIKSLRLARIYHRKLWEYGFVLQALHEAGMLQEGKRGLGFAVGEEPLPAYFAARGIRVTATDAPVDVIEGKGWTDTGQHADSLDKLSKPDLCPQDAFQRHVSYEPVDMRAIPAHLDGQFDFCWSICSLEHLGSLANGADFVIDSLKTLRTGGVAIHTTEFNYLSDTDTVDNWMTVLYRRKDFEALAERARALGYIVSDLNFDTGDKPLDYFIDLPPYRWDKNKPDLAFISQERAHLRLSIDGFACTCYGLIIRKPS